MSDLEEIKKFADKLDRFSPSMCFAKWYHLTLYLHQGENHSCYHPKPHKIPLTEIKDNPTALHNTIYKKKQRRRMLRGIRPLECHYCWKIEDIDSEQISDRMLKSYEESQVHQDIFSTIKSHKWKDDIHPTYVEVIFSNECGFKCAYCNLKSSTRWKKEIEKFGPHYSIENTYGTEDTKIYDPENNPYLDAWWEWWPELRKNLNALRISGGEPLMQKSTFRLLDSINENSDTNPNLFLMINSNLGVKPVHFDSFVEKVQKMITTKKIANFQLHTSLESWGEKAEYVRFGLDLQLWERNLRYYLNNLQALDIAFMCTFNNLCVTSFKSFLEKILAWKQEYNIDRNRISLDIPYLKEPNHFLVTILPERYLEYMRNALEFMQANKDDQDPKKFNSVEVMRLERVIAYMQNNRPNAARLQKCRHDFYAFWTETDRRRQTNFLQTFPEMKDMFHASKLAFEAQRAKKKQEAKGFFGRLAEKPREISP